MSWTRLAGASWSRTSSLKVGSYRAGSNKAAAGLTDDVEI